jgi:hypothetical protein
LQLRGEPLNFRSRPRADDDCEQDHSYPDSHDSGFCDDGYLLWAKH